jgi:putative glycosyltransferase (TIGR04372 family)
LTLKGVVRRLGLVGAARSVLSILLIVPDLLARWQLLKLTVLPRRLLVEMGNAALAQGRHAAAVDAYVAALSIRPEDAPLRLQIGVAAFLGGHYREAEKWFISTSQAKHFDAVRWGLTDTPYRVLDGSWLLAIGHVAFLDTYIKAVELNWLPQKTALLACNPAAAPAGWPLLSMFGPHIRVLMRQTSAKDSIDEIVHGPDFRKHDETSRDYMRSAVSQPFWYGPDAQGRTRWFAPFAAGVEAAWKAAGRGPLLIPSASDRMLFRRTMEELYGLPADAWFVVLHVREPGYHAAWHRRHPGTRNADIRTYDKVIDFVLSQGGWVVRGGDPTMTRIAPRERVIDYATSPRRSPEIDILLCAECHYFIGTNSGYSVVPPTFGTRCALTNWSPVGIPNWYLDDVYIPKLVRRRRDNRLLTFTELFSSFAGWSQFQRDFRKTDLIIEDNDPEDLLATVQELHAEVFGTADPVSAEDAARLRRFNEIAVAHEGYVGSRMSYRFLAKYASLLD